jgi:hypothetical protein
MGRERAQRTQVQVPLCDPLEQLGESPTQARRCDAPASGAFTHSERLDAVREQRRKPQLEMEHPLFELHQMRKQTPGKSVALPNQLRQPRQELGIPQAHQSILVPHHSCLTRVISTDALPLRNRFSRENGFEVERDIEPLASPNLVHPTAKS